MSMASTGCRIAPFALGQAAGTYWERPVAPALARHFSSLWFRKNPESFQSSIAIVPDGCADIVCVNGELWISGPSSRAHVAAPPPGSVVVGLRFQPGAAPLWLGVSAPELTDVQIPLSEFPQGRSAELVDAMRGARDPRIAALRLESALGDLAPRAQAPERAWVQVFMQLSRGKYFDGSLMRSLSSNLGTSERSLRRNSERVFGYGPKLLHRILRMQLFLKYAASANLEGIAALGAAAGYADQAHLSREARNLTGLTPAEIVKQVSAHGDQPDPLLRSESRYGSMLVT